MLLRMPVKDKDYPFGQVLRLRAVRAQEVTATLHSIDSKSSATGVPDHRFLGPGISAISRRVPEMP
jgi:hypothetical protein